MAGEFDRARRSNTRKIKKVQRRKKSDNSKGVRVSSSGKMSKSDTGGGISPKKRIVTPKPKNSGGSSGGSRRSGGSSTTTRKSSGSGGGGSSLMSTASAVDSKPEPPKEPPPPKFADWLGKDSLYNAAAGSGGTIGTELEAYLASLAETNRQFGQDTTDALRNLGWKEGKPGPDIAGLSNMTAAKSGEPTGYWDPTDQLGAYGQAQTNARNDFSGRGLMDSSFFQDATSNLDNSFNRQRNDYMNALETQENTFNTESASANSKADAARRQAKADALARYNATYNITP